MSRIIYWISAVRKRWSRSDQSAPFILQMLYQKYLLIDADVQEDVPVAVAVVHLQQRRVLRPLRAVVDVLDLLPGQLRQLKPAERPAAVEPREVAVAGSFQNQNQAVCRIVGVFDLED